MIDQDKVQAFNKAISELVPDVMEKWAETYKDKNDNYGASWLLAGETMHLWLGTVVLDTPQKHVMYGLMTRMLDKFIRAGNLLLRETSDKVGEAAQDTLSDLGVYSFMAATAARNEVVSDKKPDESKKDNGQIWQPRHMW
jgi:hypothetical protein